MWSNTTHSAAIPRDASSQASRIAVAGADGRVSVCAAGCG